MDTCWRANSHHAHVPEHCATCSVMRSKRFHLKEHKQSTSHCCKWPQKWRDAEEGREKVDAGSHQRVARTGFPSVLLQIHLSRSGYAECQQQRNARATHDHDRPA